MIKRDVVVVGEQCLHRTKVFSGSCTNYPASEEVGGAQEAGRKRSRDSWSQLTSGISHTTWHHTQHVKLAQRRKKGGYSEFWY